MLADFEGTASPSSLTSIKPMNDTTNLNSELLSADARGRKHIPFAVFAVILVHIVLFLVLLVAAGCRAKARARRNLEASPEMVKQTPATPAAGTTAPTVPATTMMTSNALPAVSRTSEPVMAEPVVERTEVRTAPKPSPQRNTIPKPTAGIARAAKVYVVQAGDTFEKIAKRHGTTIQALKAENKVKNDLLRPGQKLRVGTEKRKTSNEV